VAAGSVRIAEMRRTFFVLLLAFAVAAAAQSPSDEFATSAGPVSITPLRHASILVKSGGKVAYVDPVGTYADLPPADLVLITHTHGDHVDAKLVATLSKADTVIIAPAAAKQTFPNARILANGESTNVGAWAIEAVAAYNIKRESKPGVVYHPKGVGNGYVLTVGGKRFYFAGDTEGVPEMLALKNIEAAFIPINLPFTMTPEEAADAVRAFAPRVVYPYHYRGSDLAKFQQALKGTSTEVRLRDWYKQ
jgi:L-ascorbate metabolism protein UlaG (beta-lactamase superfamily)